MKLELPRTKYSISIVIPNYNGRALLEQNLPLVYESLSTSSIDEYEIIIPDDASTDESVTFLQDNYPKIVLVLNQKNKGFSVNTNAGILKATKDLVLILNSDIQLTRGYFIPLLGYFDKEDTFGVMGTIVESGAKKTMFAGRSPEYSFGKLGSGKNIISEDIRPLPTFFLSGANALVDRVKLLELGGFDEVFSPYYYEDNDLGIRAWRLGYKLYYEQSVSCLHTKSSTIKKEPSKKVQIIYKRNKFFYHYLHFTGVELWFYMLKQFIKALFRALFFDKKYMQSYYLFVTSLKKLNTSKRHFREVQKTRKFNSSINDVVKSIEKDLKEIKIVRL